MNKYYKDKLVEGRKSKSIWGKDELYEEIILLGLTAKPSDSKRKLIEILTNNGYIKNTPIIHEKTHEILNVEDIFGLIMDEKMPTSKKINILTSKYINLLDNIPIEKLNPDMVVILYNFKDSMINKYLTSIIYKYYNIWLNKKIEDMITIDYLVNDLQFIITSFIKITDSVKWPNIDANSIFYIWLIEKYPEILSYRSYNPLITLLVKYKHEDVFIHLAPELTKNEIEVYYKYFFEFATTKFIDWYIEHYQYDPPENLDLTIDEEITIKYIDNEFESLKELFYNQTNKGYILCKLIDNKNLALVNYILKNKKLYLLNDVVCVAIIKNNYYIIDKLIEYKFIDEKDITKYARLMIRYKSYNILENLHSNKLLPLKIANIAVENNYFDVMLWLINKGYKLTSKKTNLVKNAFENNNYKALLLLLKENHKYDIDELKIKNNISLDLIKWYYEKKKTLPSILYDIASEFNNIDLIKWLFEYDIEIDENSVIIDNIIMNNSELSLDIITKYLNFEFNEEDYVLIYNSDSLELALKINFVPLDKHNNSRIYLYFNKEQKDIPMFKV